MWYLERHEPFAISRQTYFPLDGYERSYSGNQQATLPNEHQDRHQCPRKMTRNPRCIRHFFVHTISHLIRPSRRQSRRPSPRSHRRGNHNKASTGYRFSSAQRCNRGRKQETMHTCMEKANLEKAHLGTEPVRPTLSRDSTMITPPRPSAAIAIAQTLPSGVLTPYRGSHDPAARRGWSARTRMTMMNGRC